MVRGTEMASIQIDVWPDKVEIDGRTLARPSTTCRSEWISFWEAVSDFAEGDFYGYRSTGKRGRRKIYNYH